METIALIMAVFSAIAGIVGASYSTAAQNTANQLNRELNEENREDQQQFSIEAQQQSVRDTQHLYNTLYSPQAKVSQLRNAGLSVGLMYGQSGLGGSSQSAPMAATPANAAPIINPAIPLGMLSEVGNLMTSGTGGLKQALESGNIFEDTKKKQAEQRNIDQQIKESMQRIELLAKQTGTEEIKQESMNLQNKLAEQELNFNEASWEERLKIIENNAEQIRQATEEIKERIRGQRIENDKKDDYIDAQVDLLKATKEKYVQDKAVGMAQEALLRAQKLTQDQLTEKEKLEIRKLTKIVEDYEAMGYKLTESNDWTSTLIGLLKEIWVWLDKKINPNDNYGPDYLPNGQHKDPNVHGGGGKW